MPAREPERPPTRGRGAGGRSLRWYLVVTSLLSLIPLLAFTGAIVGHDVELQRDALRRGMLSTSRALSLAVDREWAAARAILSTLASSHQLDPGGDLRAFRELCVAAAERRAGAWIVLFDRNGKPLLDTRQPFGEPGLRGPELATDEGSEAVLAGLYALRRVIETGEPVHSDLFTGTGSGEPTVSLDLPVVRDGQVLYSLRLAMRPDAFARLLEQQDTPDDAFSIIVDRRGRIVARSREHQRFVGASMSPDLGSALETGANGGWGAGESLVGPRVSFAWDRSPLTGWFTFVAFPDAGMRDVARRSIVLWAAGAVVFLGFGICLAIFVARRVTDPIETLARSADLVQRGRPVAVPESAVREVRALYEALAVAADAMRRHGAEHERRLAAEIGRKEAEAESRSKDEFVAMLSHELRNPLAAIANAATLLELIEARDERGARARRIISRQTQHLSRMLEDVLDLSRSITGKVALDRERLDLLEVASRAVETVRLTGRTDRCEIRLEGAGALVTGDRVRLEQVVTNLLNNALRHTPPGGRIDVEVGVEGDQALLVVRDNGGGIDPAILPRIFDLFFQVESPLDRANGGLGLGLTVVKRLVELQGGTVTAASAGLGRGSEFVVRLPRATASVAEVPEADPRHQAATPGLSIVLVEDNADARETLVLLLELLGHRVAAASDGASGIALVRARRPDVALVDIGLPGMDGYGVARTLREDTATRSVRLVAMTGYGREEDRARGAAAGFDDYLVKPVEAERLREVLAGVNARGPRMLAVGALPGELVEGADGQLASASAG